jgi:signal transduction histidine kinase
MKPFSFKSIYFKWIVLFACVIFAAQGLSLLFALRYILPDIGANLSQKMYVKAQFLQDLQRQGTTITPNILESTGDRDINLIFFDLDAPPEELTPRYRGVISLDMLQRAASGEIVAAYTLGSIRLPFCMMALDGRLALLTPNIQRNDLTFFIGAYQRIVLSNSIFISALIVSALVVVIRPIKKVTRATREVAGGNFNIQLKTNSRDEVGDLLRNFNLMAQTLQKNEYLKKDFVSNVSHEFKTPITSIEGFARLIKDGELSRSEINEYADIIAREAVRLSHLSSNLLQLSLLDSGAIALPTGTFLLDEQIREAVLLLQNKWEAKNIEFDIQMDEIVYTGHEALLWQVWVNLLDNAIKFSPLNGKITIVAARGSASVSVSISDQGPGISPAEIERIFDRFYKSDPSRAREGSGLGLSIVKHIADISQGTVYVDSPSGKGARFTVTLPVL